jgi:hypothetical protein
VSKSRYFIAALCLAALMTLSGCFSMTADELYSLPQASKEYLRLQEQINAVLASGAEYSPPTAGPNRQSVQLKDINGDGKSEAIAFFRTTEDKPLKIHIMQQTNGAYETADVIEGLGTAIESIRYADMDGDGTSELIVGWQMSAAVLRMSIYSVKDYQHFQMKSADYSEIVLNDINSDGCTDVIALRLPSSELPGEAEMFSLMPDGDISTFKAQLSKGIESISRIYKGSLSDETPAIFVEGGYNGGVITDILTWRFNDFVNASVRSSSGVSENTLRSYQIYSADINMDGVREVPLPRLLVSTSDTQYYVVDWFAFDKYGNMDEIFITYHNNSDGWYLILPDDWKDKITVKRNDTVAGERTLIFSYITEDEKLVDFLEIYTLSGDNKDDRAKLDGRFKLMENNDTIYAYAILTTDVDITVSRAVIEENFKPLYPEWTTGVI